MLLGFLYWWSWRSTGTNKPRQAIYFDPSFSMFLIEILPSFGLLAPCVPWVFDYFVSLHTCHQVCKVLLVTLHTYSKYANYVHRLLTPLILVKIWVNLIKIAPLLIISIYAQCEYGCLCHPSWYNGNFWAIILLSSRINFRLGKPSRFYLVVKVFDKTLGMMFSPSEDLWKERIW
jgi:hypothetical protein